jgi:ribosomal protein S17E
MTARTDFWLNEVLMRHLAYKHLEISSKKLRSIACIAGYVTPTDQLTAAGRVFAANIKISDPWLV